ncbi:PSKH1 [Sanghuangporus vaninii]
MPWNYRLISNHPLGSGPAGSFWKYEDIQTKELVAVKRIDPGTIMDVEAEVKALQAVKAKPHRHIVEYEIQVELACATAEEVEGVRYNFIVFKYLPGGSLLHLMGRLKALHIDFARSIARRVVNACYSFKQITEGLDHLHNELGLTHGDLKPENILFKDREMTQIAIADHRLVLAANVNEELKKTIIAGGTTEYLAYEVWKRSELGKPMDMWALGVITYVMLTHRFPFEFNLAKQMKETMTSKLKSTVVGDLMNVTHNPLMEATQEASANARETIEKTIEKGVDWTVFPVNEEYAQAKGFIQDSINLNDKERLTAKQALEHEFMKSVDTNVRPAPIYPVAAAGASWSMPMSPPASRPASIKSVRSNISQKSRRSSGSRYSDVESLRGDPIGATEKLMHSEYTGRKLDQISLRSVSSLGNSSIGLEDLSFWERHDRLLSMTSAQIKILLVLSVRAGFTIVDGKMKFVVPNIRSLETLLRHSYHAQRNEFYARPSRQNTLEMIREESGSEGGSRATSPAPSHHQREEPANEWQVSNLPSRASSRASVGRNERRSRPPSILGVATPRSSRPPSVSGEQAKVAPPATPVVAAEGTTGTEQQKEPERAHSPAPSKRSTHSEGGKPRSNDGSRQSSRRPSPAPKKDSAQTGTKPPSRAPTPALSTKSRSSTKEKSKEIQPESEAKVVEDAPPAPAPTETEPAPPHAPPAEEPASTPAPGDSKATKPHSRPPSVRSVKSTHSETSSAPSAPSARSARSVFSTASYRNKARKLAQVPKRPSSTPPTSGNMIPPSPATPSTPAPPPAESSSVKEEAGPSSPVIAHSDSSKTKEKSSPKATSRPASRAASTTSATRRKASKSGSEEEKKHKERKEYKKRRT